MCMDWKLELVPIPVSDVDQSQRQDARRSADAPGSACSIAFGTGIINTPPGSVQALHLVVSDINAARVELVERG